MIVPDCSFFVKVGPEAQAETVATRLVWAVGYFADEAYYLDRAEIKNLPQLSRGQEFIENRSVVRSARFEPKRKHISRGDNWDWEVNPFLKTRELDGISGPVRRKNCSPSVHYLSPFERIDLKQFTQNHSAATKSERFLTSINIFLLTGEY